MAPSRRQVAGRSPLVNQQRQITSFFGKSPSPTPSLSNKKTPKSNPNPNPNSPSPSPSPPKSNSTNPRSNPPTLTPPSPGPATPSPVQSKFKKPILVIGQNPESESAEITYGDEVVGKRVRVYWPIDKKWYDGSVVLYDKSEGKHVVEYDDGEEEGLDLVKEKIEWLVGVKSGVMFKRLRRGGSGFRRVVTDDDDDDDDDMVMSDVEEEKGDKSDGDEDWGKDKSDGDEDWGKDVEKEVCESEEDDDDEEEMVEEKDEGNRVLKTECRKRKSNEVVKLSSEKKSKTGKETILKGFKASVVEPVKKIEEGKPGRISCCCLFFGL